jgi:hypothetical protein
VFEQLSTCYPCVPVIIITGLPDQYRTAVAAGVGALFEKPVEVPALLTAIEALLADPPELRVRRLCGFLQDTRYVPPVGTLGDGRRAKTFRGAARMHSGSEFSTQRKGVL